MPPPRPPAPGHLQQQLLSLIRTEVERQLAPMRVALAKLTAFARSKRPPHVARPRSRSPTLTSAGSKVAWVANASNSTSPNLTPRGLVSRRTLQVARS